MPWTEYITAAKDIILAVAGGATAWVAIRGLSKWSDELVGKADFETARAIAKSMYALRQHVSACRNGFMMGYEFPPEFRSTLHRTPEDEARGYAHVWDTRWKPVAEAWVALDVQGLEAEALWGHEIRVAIDAIRSSLNQLRAAHESFVSDLAASGRHFRDAPDFRKQIEDTVYERPEGDVYGETFKARISAVEAMLIPHLRRRSAAGAGVAAVCLNNFVRWRKVEKHDSVV